MFINAALYWSRYQAKPDLDKAPAPKPPDSVIIDFSVSIPSLVGSERNIFAELNAANKDGSYFGQIDSLVNPVCVYILSYVSLSSTSC